jgi:hypothetical protein
MNVETAVEGAVKTVETEAKSVVEKIEGEVVKAEEAVKAALVNITAEEKLFLREAELEYLKAQLEIQRLSKITETKSKQYTDYIEGLFKKYALEKTSYIFDAAVAQFKKL